MEAVCEALPGGGGAKPRNSYLMLFRLWGGAGGGRGVLSSDDGQSLLEFALSFSVLMGLVFIFIELCLGFYTYGMIAECAREGSRYASVHGSTCVTGANASCTLSASDINHYVSGRGFPNLGGGTINVATTFPDGNQAPGSRVKVKVTYVFPITLPFVLRNSLSMGSSSEMYYIQ